MSAGLSPALTLDPTAIAWGPDGLVPAVVQDERDGRVLMLAWMDREALDATLASGEVHFHSRSRSRLWRKGEESGNVLRLRGISVDCDGDSLLIAADPVGPTCHRGTRSCFDETVGAPRGEGFGWLEALWATIGARAAERPSGSYTAKLLDGGVDLAGRKVAEEATEVLIAAKNDATADASDAPVRRAELAGESADLLYHLLVLLAERKLAPSSVLDVLRTRHAR